MSQELKLTEEVEGGNSVKPVELNPRLKLDYTERQKVLSLSHRLYAKNQHVKFEGKWNHFEPPQYHIGLANLYRKRAIS